jgi:hypothetical protein
LGLRLINTPIDFGKVKLANQDLVLETIILQQIDKVSLDLVLVLLNHLDWVTFDTLLALELSADILSLI